MYTLAKWGIISCVLFIVACSSNPAPDISGEEKSSVETARVRGLEFSSAVMRASASGWAKEEVEALVNIYTEDAILFPPKGEPIRGRDAIRAF